MNKLPKISDSEYEVMEVLWASNDYMEISDVMNALSKEKQRAYNTVGTFLIRLTEKGFLKTKKHGRANSYFPAVSEEEYIKAQTEEFVRTICKGSKRSLIAALCDTDTDDKELDELMKFVESGGKSDG